jgi:asparagine synthase (glutamine-hydrolysing)
MCGIAGIVNIHHHNLQHTAIQSMTNRIAHRGPDAEGFFIDEDIALGHRRLAIIDLKESANQPMADDSDRYVIIFNGEIYNYQDVKAKLKDYPYRTDSDSEVILAAYAKWGTSCLKEFNGQFAFAIWNKKEKELFIARDCVGEKPLYYYKSSQYFVFGSEVRSLLSSGLVPKELDEKYLSEFLMYQAPLDSHTLIRGVEQLKAGHYATIKGNEFKELPYWNYDEAKPTNDDIGLAKKKIKELFLDSVRLRMISDVPVGAFLSGGIDSSLVVACMAEISDKPVNTFSISFREKEYDESIFADQIAIKYKTNHHKILIQPEEFLYSLDEILSSMDSPSSDGHNTYLVAKHTREKGIKVALSGLGGDELFAGYNKFILYHKIMQNRWLLTIPVLIRKQFSNLILATSKNHRRSKIADLLELNEWKLSTVYPELRRSYRKEEVNEILVTKENEDYIQSKLADIDKSTCWMGEFSKCTIGELETYTKDVLLRDTDQMAMAHALEVRVPFFDYRLIEYTLSLPDAFKHPHTPKKLLVDAMKPLIPVEISNRKKMGFTFPMDHWLRNELAGMAYQKISYLSDRKEFNGSVVKEKLTAFQKGDQRILWSRIWQLFVLSDWLKRNNL